MAACSSCKAEIEWATMRGTGAAMPFEPPTLSLEELGPSDVAVRGRDRLAVVLNEEAVAKVLHAPAAFAGWTFHRSHWSSCPSREQHRVNEAQETLFGGVGRGERRRP